MKFIFSPARGIKEYEPSITCTKPVFEKEILILSERLKQYSPWDLESVLRTREKLAHKAFIDIQEFDINKVGTPALFTYDGLVYKNIAPLHLSENALDYSRETLRIISAFYGLLRPFDYISPYRLEMQSRVSVDGKNLYEFWGEMICRELFKDDTCVINLASEEYAKVVRKHLRPCDQFVDIIFCDTVKGRKKVVTTSAKMARGRMARYILENRVGNAEELINFEWDGFEYEDCLSSKSKLVFSR